MIVCIARRTQFTQKIGKQKGLVVVSSDNAESAVKLAESWHQQTLAELGLRQSTPQCFLETHYYYHHQLELLRYSCSHALPLV